MNIDLKFGNCLDFFKLMKSESIDLIVTDPPYRTTSRGATGTMGGFWIEEQTKKGKIFNHNDIHPMNYLPEFYRLLKNGTICYIMCNNKNLQEMLNIGTNIGFKFVKCLIWEKGNKICGTYYMGCYEYVIVFRKGKDRPINNCGTPDILHIPIKKTKDESGKNLHNTEKPVELMKILIENSSNINDVILDPFMGIGSTGIACVLSQRNFIGIEIDETYFNIGYKRIEKTNRAQGEGFYA